MLITHNQNQMQMVNSSLRHLPDLSNLKKLNFIESLIDPLILSCCWYRIKNQNKIKTSFGIEVLFDQKLLEQVDEKIDTELASKIRLYYSKKLTLWTLSSSNLSQFRKELSDIITSSNVCKIKKDQYGIIYKLPEFYFYDIMLDEMHMQYFSEKFNFLGTKQISTKKCIPLKKLNRHTKYNNTYQYWFVSDNVGIKLTLDSKNPLLNVWDKIYHESKCIELHGTYCYRNKSNIPHLELQNWSLINNIMIVK